MTNRGSTPASRRTPFTVHAMHPEGRHLHPFDWIRWRGFWRAGPTRRTLGRWWLLGCTCILGRQGQDVQAFGGSDGLDKGAFGLGPVGEEAAGLPAHREAIVPAAPTSLRTQLWAGAVGGRRRAVRRHRAMGLRPAARSLEGAPQHGGAWAG
jgi:hypothetical protein